MTQQKANYGQNEGGTEAAKDRLRDMADATGESVKDAAQVTDEMARQLADQARQYGEQAQDLAKQVRPFLEKSMRDSPSPRLLGQPPLHSRSAPCGGSSAQALGATAC